ncbi:MAG: HAMP domain-containing protein [Hyphomicrobiales bacterium]|nr:HAMP domain-containing protein [Hyphomicrobiales bacterium]
MKLPQLSIAIKLYAIFALLATATVALAISAVVNASYHAALVAEFGAAFKAGQHVERINALINALVMETRGIYLAEDATPAEGHGRAIGKLSEKVTQALEGWRQAAPASDADSVREITGRVRIVQDSTRAVVRRLNENGLAAARQMGSFDGYGAVHEVLSNNLEALSRLYAGRAERAYVAIDDSILAGAWSTSLLAILAIALAGAGAFLIWQQIARPLAGITSVTERIAAGDLKSMVPHRARGDEVGALARSIAVFQDAMRRNEELGNIVREDAQARADRQERMSLEIARFGSEVEATLAELGRIAAQMLSASGRLSGAAENASTRTNSAAAASADASSNVRDIASAADELAASVNEIDRQVAQSNSIAGKAVSEAERTHATVKELDEAAGRIGDVVRLITDIAEQTNLLALNATIEAARAGDAGRGFAVVASEVKELAGQTAKATEEIGAQIAGMQHATQRSIDAIGAIERTIRDIGDISSAIAAAVTEQGAATQEIARSVETAARRTIDTADEVVRVGEATAQTRDSAGAVKAVAGELGQVATRIRSQVDQFFAKLNAA